MQTSSELMPLISNANMERSDSSVIIYDDKLPSYNESISHLVVSVNIPPPPPYQLPNYSQQSAQVNQTSANYPVLQVFLFGLCMLIGGGLLYAFKHGL